MWDTILLGPPRILKSLRFICEPIEPEALYSHYYGRDWLLVHVDNLTANNGESGTPRRFIRANAITWCVISECWTPKFVWRRLPTFHHSTSCITLTCKTVLTESKSIDVFLCITDITDINTTKDAMARNPGKCKRNLDEDALSTNDIEPPSKKYGT